MVRRQKSNESESKPDDQHQIEAQQSETPPCPIVGVGASAGGLDAFTQLLRFLPVDTGLAFVLIQHLSPEYESMLTELLSRQTQMPVTQISQDMQVVANHVYIIPPNRKLILVGGQLHLSPREKTRGGHYPIDAFFESLARERGEQAISVVLSGADGDGARGLAAIKAVGGITFAQDRASAQFGGMPQTAVDTGQVDYVLPPQGIAEELARIGDQLQQGIPVRKPVEQSATPSAEDGPAQNHAASPSQSGPPTLSTIFDVIFAAKGVDFTYYKLPTLSRRIARRMRQQGLENLESYHSYLQQNPAELQSLYQDLLINVTSFFRDPEVFETLKTRVFPAITADKSPQLPIRIWVPGCASGEEAYSIAICLLEFFESHPPQPSIQIFATDVNEALVEIARTGLYKLRQLEGVSPERLSRFFVGVEGEYQIAKRVRELCVFARQNLGADPPFSHLDLISCRNVLIYLGAALQKKVLASFHYGLKPTGFLLLGSSETTNDFTEMFVPLDKKQKIYAKKPTPMQPYLSFVADRSLPAAAVIQPSPPSPLSSELELQQIADRLIWDRYAPPGVLINADLDILQFRGDTSPYLRPAPGKPSFNLLKMVRPNFAPELRALLRQAKNQGTAVRKSDLPLEGDDSRQRLSIEVLPLQLPTVQTPYFLILFERSVLPEVVNPAPPTATRPRARQTAFEQDNLRLRQELATSRDHLQAIIEEREAAIQDLRAANEEILSSNEELQSTNEELETAKEEIQATNEELNTINEELRGRNLETEQLNNDLLNILSSATLPILILGTHLEIRRFTPMAQSIFNLIPTDVGRSLRDIRHTLQCPDLEGTIAQVIDTLHSHRQEVQDQQGHWYDLTIRPYKTRENQIVGAVLVLVDIDALKRSMQQLQDSRDYASAIVETIWEPLLVLDGDLRVVTANHSFYQTFQVEPGETEHHWLADIGNGQWNIPYLQERLRDILAGRNSSFEFEIQHEFERIGQKFMVLNVRQIKTATVENLLLLAIIDVTDRKRLETEREHLLVEEKQARTQAESANRAKDLFLSILSHELRNPLSAILGWTQLLSRENFTPTRIQEGLAIIARNANLQNELIQDLLDVTRITSGKLRLNSCFVDLNPLVAAAIETVELSIQEKNLQLETRFHPFPLRVWGDPARLQQVFWNLLSNAIKFTPEGGRIGVCLSAVSPSPDSSAPTHAQIQVSDTGPGISPDFLPHIFDRFLQEEGIGNRSNTGLGLGLTIVRSLVEQHGGTVRVSSQLGEGTTFTINLPLQTSSREKHLSAPVESAAEPVPPTAISAQFSSLEGVRVLVVEDQVDVQELVKIILEQCGAQVSAVGSVALALQTLMANPGTYDVLISDIGMPEQDGFALIRQVRLLENAKDRQIPAAALTAYANPEEKRAVLDAGFQVHISKPVDTMQLSEIVASLAGRM